MRPPSKTVSFPGTAASAAVDGCKFNNCTASIDAHGKDLGIDSVATGKRNDAVLKLRSEANREKSDRHKFLVNTMTDAGVGSSMWARLKLRPGRP